MEPVSIYQPMAEKRFRVAWYGGESTQLHFQKCRNVFDLDNDKLCTEWTDRDVRTLGGGIPNSMKELLMEMVDYYEYSCTMEEERRQEMM